MGGSNCAVSNIYDLVSFQHLDGVPAKVFRVPHTPKIVYVYIRNQTVRTSGNHTVRTFLMNGFLFYSNSNSKVLKNRFLQLLARSWFWRTFFPVKFKLKSIEKLFFRLLARSWFFLFNFYFKKVLSILYFQFLARSWFW